MHNTKLEAIKIGFKYRFTGICEGIFLSRLWDDRTVTAATNLALLRRLVDTTCTKLRV